jgi:outer membrane lipoprotein-sorting protein
MLLSRAILASPIVVLAFFIPIGTPAGIALDTEILISKIKAAYDGVMDYQGNMEVSTRGRDGSFLTYKFLYTHKKPDWIRLDFETPHSGMILVYPDANGKVVIRPSGWGRSFQIHLTPDSFLLRDPSGQLVTHTDLGVLIRNITHSLTDQRRGPVKIEEENGSIQVRVLADNHFQEGVLTLYQFFIDREQWLPAKVEEYSPEGLLERTVTFHNLRTNIGISDQFFQLDGSSAR